MRRERWMEVGWRRLIGNGRRHRELPRIGGIAMAIGVVVLGHVGWQISEHDGDSSKVLQILVRHAGNVESSRFDQHDVQEPKIFSPTSPGSRLPCDGRDWVCRQAEARVT
jgi:hypothetical protein